MIKKGVNVPEAQLAFLNGKILGFLNLYVCIIWEGHDVVFHFGKRLQAM